MTIKYIILAFVAIQAINAGVIKQRSPESDFQDLLAKLQEYVDKTPLQTKAVEDAYDRTKSDVIEVAEVETRGGHAILDQIELEIVTADPWAVKCFENVHDQADKAGKVLLAKTNECIKSADPLVVEHVDNGINYQHNVKLVADKMKEDWDKCNDTECQVALLESSRTDVLEFSKKFIVLSYSIVAFLQEQGFKDVRTCEQTASEEYYDDYLMAIVDDIQKCVQAGP